MDFEEQNKTWDEIIRPKRGWFDINLSELWRYRDLVMMFVKRDFVSIYKQTILGPLWYILQALFTTLMFTIVFGKIAKLSTDGIPPILFYLSGVVCWNYFSQCLTKTSSTFIANANIFGKVYFPRLTVPVSTVISNLIGFAIQLVILICFILYYKFQGIVSINFNLTLLMFPFLVILMAALSLGIGIIISSLTTKYRDLQQVVIFGVQLLMYATPVIYPLSSLGGNFRLMVLLNPMTAIVETFRYSFLGCGSFNWNYIIYSVVCTIIIFFIGVLLFNRVERSFMDTV